MSDQRIGTATVCLTAATLPYPRVPAGPAHGDAPPYGGPWPSRGTSATPGVLELPSGRRVRGRGVREPGRPSRVRTSASTCCRARRPAFRGRSAGCGGVTSVCPPMPSALRTALIEVWERAADERVEVACRGGTGRTGTALACLAVLDGVPAGRGAWPSCGPATARGPWRPRPARPRRPFHPLTQPTGRSALRPAVSLDGPAAGPRPTLRGAGSGSVLSRGRACGRWRGAGGRRRGRAARPCCSRSRRSCPRTRTTSSRPRRRGCASRRGRGTTGRG